MNKEFEEVIIKEEANKKEEHSVKKWKIALFCGLFNVFAEMSVRGYSGTLIGLLPIWLFLHYYTFFLIIIDISFKSSGNDKAIFLAALSYGYFVMTFETGLGYLFGIASWLIVVVCILMGEWSLLQTVLTLYFSGRLFGWNIENPKLSKKGWVICIGYLVLFSIFSFPGAIKGQIWLYFLTLIVAILTIRKTKKVMKESDRDTNLNGIKNSNLFLDYWFILTVLIAILGAFIFPIIFEPFFTRDGREFLYIQSFILMTLWSLFSLISIFFWRKKNGKIPLPN